VRTRAVGIVLNLVAMVPIWRPKNPNHQGCLVAEVGAEPVAGRELRQRGGISWLATQLLQGRLPHAS
jgi:hypothetical protein